jgi:hypothetical protein
MEEQYRSKAGQSFGIAGLVTGIVAVIVGVIPCIGQFAILLGAVAVVFSAIALNQASQGKGAKDLIIAALVISIVGTILGGVQWSLTRGLHQFFEKHKKEIHELIDNQDSSKKNMDSLEKKMDKLLKDSLGKDSQRLKSKPDKKIK